MADPEHPFAPDVEQALEAYLRKRLKPPHSHPTFDTRVLGWIGAIAGAYVVWEELTYRGPASTLTPILAALGIGVTALAAAHLLRHR